MYITINSEFRPFTYDELTKPLRDYTEAYNKVEEQYATLAQQTEAWKNIATQENSPEAYAMYKKYSDELNAVVEDFSRGMTIQNRGKLTGLKSRYASEITPIANAYNAMQTANKYRETVRANDNTAIFAVDRYTSLDDFLHGKTADNSYISGKQIEATAASRAQSASYNKFNELRAAGVDSDTAAKSIVTDDSEESFKNKLIQDSLGSLDLSGYDEETKQRIMDHISLGVQTGVGMFATQEYISAAQRAQLDMQERQHKGSAGLQYARFAAEMQAKGYTPQGKIDPTSPVWQAEGYEFGQNEDGSYTRDAYGNPIITKRPSASGPVDIHVPGLGVELNITNSAVKAGTYVLGDGSATSKAIEKAMKDSRLFKDLPDVDLSEYRATVSVDEDGIKTYKITKVPSVKSKKNPNTQSAENVSLPL
jgi:hypothetical protein